jgi:hypothetical protein
MRVPLFPWNFSEAQLQGMISVRVEMKPSYPVHQSISLQLLVEV